MCVYIYIYICIYIYIYIEVNNGKHTMHGANSPSKFMMNDLGIMSIWAPNMGTSNNVRLSISQWSDRSFSSTGELQFKIGPTDHVKHREMGRWLRLANNVHNTVPSNKWTAQDHTKCRLTYSKKKNKKILGSLGSHQQPLFLQRHGMTHGVGRWSVAGFVPKFFSPKISSFPWGTPHPSFW